MSYSATYEQFHAAMRQRGIITPEPIPADGQLHRFYVEGDRRGSRNGWAVLYPDGVPAGAFGSWRLGISDSWCARSHEHMTPADRQANRQRIERARQQVKVERIRAHAAAADRAAELWGCAHSAEARHPYLIRKQVPPLNARQHRSRLVLPVTDFAGQLHSLQFIDGEGSKMLLKDGRKRGHFIHVAGLLPLTGRVLICEGWATGATLAQMEPQALVLAAIDAGNLAPVAIGARQRWPAADIVVCADADPVGTTKARSAAIAAGALWTVPEFPEGTNGSDFNDLAAALAQEAV
jgi:putative DNA primase/helicase